MHSTVFGNMLLRIYGWRGIYLLGDSAVFDRLRWIGHHLQSGSLKTLDAGCGNGAFTFYAALKGNWALGISNDAIAIQVASQRASMLGIRNAHFDLIDLRTLDQHDLGVFDQIICCEVIEHIRDDRKLLQDLSSLLKPEGRLLLTTPFKYHRQLFGDRLSSSEDGGHVREGYIHNEIACLLKDVGLEVVRMEYISGFISQQANNLCRRVACWNPKASRILAMVFKPLQLVDTPITKILQYPFLSIAVVAVKKQ